MDQAQIIAFDWHRLWIGDLTPWFMLEVCFRTAVMFVWLLLMIRVIGKRGVGQFSVLELSIVVALGSAAGDPMFYADVPLLHAMLVVSLVVLMQRGLAWWIIRSERVETFLEGTPIELIRDGVLDLAALAQARLSLEDVFENLRQAGVRQLGQVERAYLEQNGHISVIQHECLQDAPLGLPIVPPWDLHCPPTVSYTLATADQPLACLGCGYVSTQPHSACPRCGHAAWTWARQNPLRPLQHG